jgi:hypothetical protein
MIFLKKKLIFLKLQRIKRHEELDLDNLTLVKQIFLEEKRILLCLNQFIGTSWESCDVTPHPTSKILSALTYWPHGFVIGNHAWPQSVLQVKVSMLI